MTGSAHCDLPNRESPTYIGAHAPVATSIPRTEAGNRITISLFGREHSGVRGADNAGTTLDGRILKGAPWEPGTARPLNPKPLNP